MRAFFSRRRFTISKPGASGQINADRVIAVDVFRFTRRFRCLTSGMAEAMLRHSWCERLLSASFFWGGASPATSEFSKLKLGKSGLQDVGLAPVGVRTYLTRNFRIGCRSRLSYLDGGAVKIRYKARFSFRIRIEIAVRAFAGGSQDACYRSEGFVFARLPMQPPRKRGMQHRFLRYASFSMPLVGKAGLWTPGHPSDFYP